MIGTFLLANQALADDLQKSWNFKSAQVGMLTDFQGGGWSTGPFLRYAPEFTFSEKWSVGASVLGSVFKENSNSSTFALGELAIFGAYHISASFDVRIFGGIQSWGNSHGTGFTVGPEGQYHFSHHEGSFIPMCLDSIFILYRSASASPHANEVGVGLGFQF